MDNKKGVTFETKCYYNDWEFLIKKNLLSKMISNCNYNFANKTLFLNNFKDYKEIKTLATSLINNRIIDDFYIVEEYEKEVLDFFGLDKNDFRGGYYYSIAELVSIYLCKTPYLLHFSSDTIISENCKTNWIDLAIDVMENNEEVFVANPTWNSQYKEAELESYSGDNDWFYSYGFSDQCYLIKTENFKKQIYNEINVLSGRYPKYGGELFEKRVDAYMRNHKLKRITCKRCSYHHQNFTKNKFLRFLKLKTFPGLH